MDLNLTPQELRFRDEVRAWFAANVPKDWVKRRNEEESMQARFDYLRAWQRKLYDAGWAGISWPKDFGGRGATVMEQVIFIEEMARAEAPPMANVLGLGLIGPTIIAFGTPEQKKRYLAKMLSARKRSGARDFRSRTRAAIWRRFRPTAKLDGDHFVVNGQKVLDQLRLGGGLVRAGRAHGSDCSEAQGLTALLVDMKVAGVEVRGLKQMSGESEFGEIFFRDVRVPVENVVGKVNEGWGVAMGTLMHERGTFGAALQVNYRRNFNRLVEIAQTDRPQRQAGGARIR